MPFARGWALVVDGHQVIDVDVSVALRGAQAGVSEHLLDRAQVRPLAQQVGREAVAERVGRDARRAGQLLATGEQPAHGARPEPQPASGDEQGRGARRPAGAAARADRRGAVARRAPRAPWPRAARCDPCVPCPGARARTRRAPSTSMSPTSRCRPPRRAARRRRSPRTAPARGPAWPASGVRAGTVAVEQAADVVLAQERRQPLGALGRAQRRDRAATRQPPAHGQTEERAQRGQLATDGHGVVRSMERRKVGAAHADVKLVERRGVPERPRAA